MANNFKPLYHSEYSSMGALINQVLPNEVAVILGAIKLLAMKNPEGVDISYSWLVANIPPYQKFIKDYTELKSKLQDCKEMYNHWVNVNKRKSFPVDLSDQLYILYEKWWVAYNDSGAGIRGALYIPRDQRVANAIRNL